ncbi:MAG: IclR family transcriptional regulator [Bacillota bacterium]
MKHIEATIKVIELLCATDNAVGVREAARAVDMSKSVIQRTLQVLQEAGISTTTPDGRYRAGPKLYGLAAAVLSRFELREAARAVMQEMWDRCQEGVYLGLLDREELVFVDKIDSLHPIQYVLPLGQRTLLHVGAAGKAVLAAFSTDEVEKVIRDKGLSEQTPRTITDRSRLVTELDQTRQRGYALSVGERIIGAVGIAAPIIDALGKPVGSFVITIPESRFNRADEGDLAKVVMWGAKRLSMSLGFLDELPKLEAEAESAPRSRTRRLVTSRRAEAPQAKTTTEKRKGVK